MPMECEVSDGKRYLICKAERLHLRTEAPADVSHSIFDVFELKARVAVEARNKRLSMQRRTNPIPVSDNPFDVISIDHR